MKTFNFCYPEQIGEKLTNKLKSFYGGNLEKIRETPKDVETIFDGIRTLPNFDKIYALLWVLENWYSLSTLSIFNQQVEKGVANILLSDEREFIYQIVELPNQSFSGNITYKGEEYLVKDITEFPKEEIDSLTSELFVG
jgi:hypothetical protein